MINFPNNILSESFPIFEKLPPSMTSIRERKVLKYLARCFYSGVGEIVDLGSGVAGTVYPFALGLSKNQQVLEKKSRIYAYDAFTTPEQKIAARGGKKYFQNTGEAQKQDSYLHIFQKNCKTLIDYVNVCDGDITTLSWINKPIEIIHIDIAKTLKVWQHIAKEFFPNFCVNQTIVIHQDFHRSRLPWLIYSTGIILPYIELLDQVVDGVIYFKITQEIPSVILGKLAEDDFSIDEKIDAINKIIEVLDDCTFVGKINKDLMKGLMNLGIAYIYYYFGNKQTSSNLAEELKNNKTLAQNYPGFFRELGVSLN
ncbi:hypothetical protein [Dapis sp. BLCC M126]|uniref:hypothetical protein n=1 Tax=Dapis sp. BLCC M126 TaxID=3400189 RepID=UPI003CF5650C